MPGWQKVSGVWREAPQPAAKVLGTWRTDTPAAFVKVGGVWRQWHAAGGAPLPPGDVLLNATSISIPGSLASSAWALFNTAPHQGSIINAYAVISYNTFFATGLSFGLSGRASGTFYRTIADVAEWNGRTINHQINAGVSQFNAGSATGYTLTRSGGGTLLWATYVTNLRLKFTVS